MKLSQLLTAPNQLTLLRMMFVPFIVINLVAGHYQWALILFVLAGFSDGLDGLLARTLKQQTVLGQYLDPIADKLLLSTMFMVLAILHKIAWKYTVLVFSRDISILFASAVLYAIAGLRRRLVLTDTGPQMRSIDDRRSHRGGGIGESQQGARIGAGISLVHRLLRGTALHVPRCEREDADKHRDQAEQDFFHPRTPKDPQPCWRAVVLPLPDATRS